MRTNHILIFPFEYIQFKINRTRSNSYGSSFAMKSLKIELAKNNNCIAYLKFAQKGNTTIIIIHNIQQVQNDLRIAAYIFIAWPFLLSRKPAARFRKLVVENSVALRILHRLNTDVAIGTPNRRETSHWRCTLRK